MKQPCPGSPSVIVRALTLALVLALAGTATPTLAASRTKKQTKTEQPKTEQTPLAPRPAKDVETRIQADKMTYLAGQQRAVFEDKVHVMRPDFQLWADTLTVHMKEPAKGAEGTSEGGSLPQGMAAGDVDKLVAAGNVRMSSEGGRSGSCSKATYLVDQGVLRMEGNPRVSDGDNTISGETILYYTRENRSEVLGGTKKRVEAVFSSPAKPTREGGKR